MPRARTCFRRVLCKTLSGSGWTENKPKNKKREKIGVCMISLSTSTFWARPEKKSPHEKLRELKTPHKRRSTKSRHARRQTTASAMAALRLLSVVLVFATPRFTKYVKKKNQNSPGLRFYIQRPCTLVYGAWQPQSWTSPSNSLQHQSGGASTPTFL